MTDSSSSATSGSRTGTPQSTAGVIKIDDPVDFEKRLADISSRIDNFVDKQIETKRRKGGATTQPTTETSETTNTDVDTINPEEPVFIKNLPTSDQTNGISPLYVRLCAQICSDNYSKISGMSEFENVTQLYNNNNNNLNLTDATDSEAEGLKQQPPKVVLYDNNAPFEATNPPFVAVVAGTKLILCWRGSITLMDFVRDLSFFVASSFRWKSVAKVVKVFGGYLAAIDNDMSVHEDFLLKIIDTYNITEILLTGHSLGGGVAQVAQLWFTGTMDPLIDPTPNRWQQLAQDKGLTVRCLSFEGPSTTVFVPVPQEEEKSDDDDDDDNDINQKGIDFLNKCGSRMCTTAYGMDVVPRVPHNVTFLGDWIDNFLNNIEKDPSDNFFEDKITQGIINGIKRYILQQQNLINVAKTYVAIAGRYQHIGKVLYYASADSKPEVYIDNTNGILTNTERLPEFTDIPFVPTDGSVARAARAILYDHMFIINGPGLSYQTRKKSISK